MRISDWSSDVCSSDLRRRKIQRLAARPCDGLDQIGPIAAGVQYLDDKAVLQRPGDRDHVFARHAVSPFVSSGRWRSRSPKPRSEEHTSELQSLMRISYAVFCLKKKKQTTHINS